MKDWFNNLESKSKLFIIIGLYVATAILSLLTQYSDIFAFIAVPCLAFAIIFTVFYSKSKKEKANQETSYQDIPTQTTTSSTSVNQIVEPEKKIEIGGDFPKIYQNHLCRWQYKENICFVQNLDKLKLGDSDIELIPEPDNQYDSNAVALYKGSYKLGYVHKGNLQKMILDYLNDKNYEITVAVYLLDPETNRLGVKIGFYRNLETWKLDSITAPLIKITKKKDVLGSSRYENLSFCSADDLVELYAQDDDGGYTVENKYGEEIGELSARAMQEITEYCCDIQYAKITSIESDDEDKYDVKITVFYN